MKLASFSFLFIIFSSSAQTPVLSPYEQRDLQLFTTYQQEPGLIASIDRTVTVIGKDYLRNQLTNPLISTQALLERQAGIQFLLEHDAIYEDLKSILSSFSEYEESLSIGNSASDSICSSVISNFFFKNKYLTWLNKYPAGLELGQVAHVTNLSFPLVEHLAIHFLLSEKLKSAWGIECGHHHHHEGACDHSHGSSTALAAYNLYNLIHTGIHVAGVKGLIDHVRQQSQVITAIQQDLINLNIALDQAYAICTIIRANPELKKYIDQAQALDDLFAHKEKNSPQLKEFLELMDKNTFRDEPSLFSRIGNILRAYSLIKEVHTELMHNLSALAQIDFLINVVTLVKESRNTNTPYTFAEFKAQSAQLVIEGFWNPLFNNMQPISYKIKLGDNNPTIAIVTGPNKAGKSTSLQAISLATLLAQTLTIVPAKQMSLSPFANFKTGFNMPARVNQGQSLFSASLDFAQEIIKTAQANPDQPIFIAIDELFNSTAFDQGSAIAQRFCQELSTLPNCICFMATHFSDLTKFEAECPQSFRNYKAELATNNNHQTHYVLAPGISEVRNVLQLIDQEKTGIKFV